MDLDQLCKNWEGVTRSKSTSESGTVHSGALFRILQAHWDPVNGFFDAGCGSGIVLALASMWASIQKYYCSDKTLGTMRGVEISLPSLLRSKLLASCGKFLASVGGLEWPKTEFEVSDLQIESTWDTSITFALLNNCKFGEDKRINQNALNYLCQEKRKLICFQFSSFPFKSTTSITCLQKKSMEWPFQHCIFS